MERKIFFFGVALACIIAGIATMGCAKKSSAQNARNIGDTLVLNLYDTSQGVNWMDSITGNYADSIGGGYWNRTYDGTAITLHFEDFVLTHSSTGSGSGGTYGYWDGFTTGSNGDNGNYGFSDTTAHAGSVKWVDNQWGVMAGGGFDSLYNFPVKGAPYLLAYWGYYLESSGQHSLEVRLADSSLFAPQEIYICNHPWPYWGNIYGDGFARPLNQSGDRFDLWIHAVKSNQTEDSLRLNLARNLVPGQSPFERSDWQQVELSSLFSGYNDSIQYLYFTMYSTDQLVIGDINYGPNTAVYFNMDRLKVIKQGAAPAGAVAQKAPTTTVHKSIEVTDEFPVPSYTGGAVTVHDTQGKEILKTTVKAGEKVNLSNLPAGDYRLRHGHKHIPFKKVK